MPPLRPRQFYPALISIDGGDQIFKNFTRIIYTFFMATSDSSPGDGHPLTDQKMTIYKFHLIHISLITETRSPVLFSLLSSISSPGITYTG